MKKATVSCILIIFVTMFSIFTYAETNIFSKLMNYVSTYGYESSITQAIMEKAPMGKTEDWYCLKLNQQDEILVYFDESNRADYITRFLDREQYTLITRFGLRFVLTYSGNDPKVIEMLGSIENSTY